MKLSIYAKKLGVSYRTAWNWWKDGKLDGYKTSTGTIIIKDENKLPNKIAIYTRVSSNENKDNLDRQAERLINYSTAKGYQIYKIVKEIGSGINDNRKQLQLLLKDKNYNILIIEHKDRLTRFGFNYLNLLTEEQGKKIEVVNNSENSKDDLMQDFISIITSFCARIYGLRRSKRATERIIKELNEKID